MKGLVKQSIIVKKSHPDVKDRGDAEKVARQYADRIYTSRETKSSYRFRQIDDDKIVEGSWKTQIVNKYVSIVWGKLKGKTVLTKD